MNRIAVIALSFSAFFLIVMAVLVNSPALFYMATAVMITLGASRLQAWLAIRFLKFERHMPPAVRVGEYVTVAITVWSERRIKRPLVAIIDGFPSALIVKDRTPSLPIAPSFDQPIQSRYSFRPMRRGRFRWSKLVVRGTDALGLVTLDRTYSTETVDMTVYPAPLPVHIELNPTAGWGHSDLETGRTRGAGLETRGLREYSPGDPMKWVHWPSTARTGRIMVKEFDAGSGVTMLFFVQRTQGSEVGVNDATTLEAMCGHGLYLACEYIHKGAAVWFPQFEREEVLTSHPDAREREVRDVLTDIESNVPVTLTQDLEKCRHAFRTGGTLVVMISAQDPDLPGYLSRIQDMKRICLIYNTDDYDDPKRRGPRPKNAADPVFLAQLETAGAEIVMMPEVTSLV